MASDDEDESLAKFLESEVLSNLSDQEEENLEEDEDEGEEEREEKTMQEGSGISDEEMEREVKRMSSGGTDSVEEEERQVKRMLAEDGEMSDEEEERETKRMRVGEGDFTVKGKSMVLTLPPSLSTDEHEATSSASNRSEVVMDENNSRGSRESRSEPKRIESGICSKIPPELFHHILKFLSSEDLVSCSMVCRFLNYAASDESLWRRLYCLRWGLLPPNKKLRECAWKKLYIQRDEEDMVEFVRNCPPEFKEYYIQMQVAKRSQAPLLSQVCDDRVILDKTVGDQVSIWKKSRGLSDVAVGDHACSGETCTYYQIGDVFVCEKTGQVHVCDDTCREVIADPANELLVCTISGRCFDRLLSPAEMEPDADQQQGGVTDEAEPFMGSGRFARAYLLGYNCADEKELEATLRFC